MQDTQRYNYSIVNSPFRIYGISRNLAQSTGLKSLLHKASIFNIPRIIIYVTPSYEENFFDFSVVWFRTSQVESLTFLISGIIRTIQLTQWNPSVSLLSVGSLDCVWRLWIWSRWVLEGTTCFLAGTCVSWGNVWWGAAKSYWWREWVGLCA